MRPDNRPLSLPLLTEQREAAPNPPPLKHLAHYLSVFVFFYLGFLSMKLLQKFVFLEQLNIFSIEIAQKKISLF